MDLRVRGASCSTSLGRSGPESNGNEGVLYVLLLWVGVELRIMAMKGYSIYYFFGSEWTWESWQWRGTPFTSSLGRSGPGNDGNEGSLHIPQNSRSETSPSDAVKCHIQKTRWEGLTSLQRCILRTLLLLLTWLLKEREPRYEMHLSVIPRTTCFVRLLPLCKGQSQHILSHMHRMKIIFKCFC